MATGSKAEKWWSAPQAVLRCAVTLVSVASAVFLAWVIWRFWHSEAFASLFFCAVIFSAWFGGYRQGLLAVTASPFAFDFYLLSPHHSFFFKSNHTPPLFTSLFSSLFT